MTDRNTTPEKRATILALWRLQKIILDSLDFDKVVQKIVDGLLTELGYLELGYKIVVLTLIDEEEQVLKRISLSHTQEAFQAQAASPIAFRDISIPLSAKENLLIRVLNEKRPRATHYWPDLFVPALAADDALKNQQASGIKTSMVYPVIVGEKAIGVLILSMVKDESEVTDDERDLIGGFTDIVGIAVQNSQLYSRLEKTTRQMNDKNVELIDTNKMLSVLRKIDVIILSAVNDPKLIAKQVANVIVEEVGFGLVSICIVNDSVLSPLATAFTQTASTLANLEHHPLINDLPLTVQNNVVIQAVKDRETKITENLYDIVGPYHAVDEIVKMQEFMKISHFIAFPIIVREEVIGAMVIGLNQTIDSLSQSQKDLIDRLAGVIGIAIDNALLYKKIEDANKRLEQLDKMKDEFVSLASHELRTPMTVIKSYVWLMLQGKVGELNEKQKVYLDRTYASVDRLINLVNDMLNISRIESGRLQITPAPIDMNAVITDVVTEMSSRAQEQEIHLEAQTMNNLPKVNADVERIKQVLINLVGNSLKFTPKLGYIKVGVYVKDGFVVTQVSDTGKGISAEDLPKLFQKFNMVGENYMTKLNIQGTGLGLYLSKSLVELHGGKIWVESDGEGHGSTFSFSLPIVKDESASQASVMSSLSRTK